MTVFVVTTERLERMCVRERESMCVCVYVIECACIKHHVLEYKSVCKSVTPEYLYVHLCTCVCGPHQFVTSFFKIFFYHTLLHRSRLAPSKDNRKMRGLFPLSFSSLSSYLITFSSPSTFPFLFFYVSF